MDHFSAQDAADELAFRKQLPSLLPADEPLRSVGPLLAIISGYAITAPFRMIDLTDPAWNDLFYVLPSSLAYKSICLNFWQRAAYKNDNIQFQYGIPIGMPTVDPTRPVWYECLAQLVYAKNLLTGARYPLSTVAIKPDGRVSLCCTAPDVIYAAYSEAEVPTITSFEGGESKSRVFQNQKHFRIGDIVFNKNGDDDITLYVQTNHGPHRAQLSPERLVPILNELVPTCDWVPTFDKPNPSWSPYLLVLANGMMLAQTYAGDRAAVIVVVDPARNGWIQRITTMDTSFHSIAISRSDRNLLYVAATEKQPNVRKRRLLALRLLSDFWI